MRAFQSEIESLDRARLSLAAGRSRPASTWAYDALVAAFKSGERGVLLIGKPSAELSRAARQFHNAHVATTPLDHGDASTLEGIYAASGLGPITGRPLRAPHHTVSEKGMTGGFSLTTPPRARPGEVTLAHAGTLVLDELQEFKRGVVDAVARGLKRGWFEFVRGSQRSLWSAKPLFVVATSTPYGGRLGAPLEFDEKMAARARQSAKMLGLHVVEEGT